MFCVLLQYQFGSVTKYSVLLDIAFWALNGSGLLHYKKEKLLMEGTQWRYSKPQYNYYYYQEERKAKNIENCNLKLEIGHKKV